MNLKKGITDHQLIGVDGFVIVAIVVEVVPRFEKLIDFWRILVRVANF